MPKQVATEMLANPKAKLSNTFRKQCQFARAKVYPSTGPITAIEGVLNEPDYKAKPVEEKILARMKKSTTPQLLKWGKRCVSKRRKVQQQFEKIRNAKGASFDHVRQLLVATAQRIDEVAGTIDEVLGDRFKHYAFNDAPHNHVHPRHKRDYKPNKKICLAA